ncbi:hypothetical protein VTI74DRAFT_2251 [Chaetomium olivicolor]
MRKPSGRWSRRRVSSAILCPENTTSSAPLSTLTRRGSWRLKAQGSLWKPPVVCWTQPCDLVVEGDPSALQHTHHVQVGGDLLRVCNQRQEPWVHALCEPDVVLYQKVLRWESLVLHTS